MGEISADTAHTAAFWDERYAGSEPVWSGRVNQRLVEQTGPLMPGAALDIGCGEGGDAVWLAGQGWTVLAVDVSVVVIDKARAHAVAALDGEVAGRITWQQADLRTWQPPAGSFDLVSMQFLQLPRAVLTDTQARLAVAVRPGGTLLIVNHDLLDLHTTAGRPNLPEMFLTVDEIAATLDSDCWRAEVVESFQRPFTDHDGNPITIHDAVVRAVRLP
ncbi:MAG: class I SAM-dependent methyltransferase [Jatrophihabitantaceae bacterium]